MHNLNHTRVFYGGGIAVAMPRRWSLRTAPSVSHRAEFTVCNHGKFSKNSTTIRCISPEWREHMIPFCKSGHILDHYPTPGPALSPGAHQSLPLHPVPLAKLEFFFSPLLESLIFHLPQFCWTEMMSLRCHCYNQSSCMVHSYIWRCHYQCLMLDFLNQLRKSIQ